MTDFERDVIDRLARIETKSEAVARLSETVILQGARIDHLEQTLAAFKNRVWGIVAIASVFVPQLLTYLKVQIFGLYHP